MKRNATITKIKSAYRKLAKKYHPDKVKGKEKKDAEEYFKRINEAYSVLSDPQKRKYYDKFGKRGLDNSFPKNGTIFYTNNTQNFRSRRKIIEDRLNEKTDFSIKEFAKVLDVKVKNLKKILSKMIEKGMVDAKIDKDRLVHN